MPRLTAIDDEVSLRYYRLQKISEGAIILEPGAGGIVYGPTEVGTGLDHQEKIQLSRLIDLVNELVFCDVAFPFFLRIKVHLTLHAVEAGRVGTVVGAAGLRQNVFNFGEAEQYFADVVNGFDAFLE